ncbi:9689_t:CDS:2, partial [Paraglomus occultum]
FPFEDPKLDLQGGWRGYLIEVRVLDENEIPVDEVEAMERELARFDKVPRKIGILVARFKDKITAKAEKRAKSSDYDIILTDSSSVYSDLTNFVESKQS